MSRKSSSTFIENTATRLHDAIDAATSSLLSSGDRCQKDISCTRILGAPTSPQRSATARQALRSWLEFGFDILLIEEGIVLPTPMWASKGGCVGPVIIDFICVTRTRERIAVNLDDPSLGQDALDYRSGIIAGIDALECTVSRRFASPTLQANLRLLSSTLELGLPVSHHHHLRAGLGLCMYLSGGRTPLGVGARRVADEQGLSQHQVIGLAYWLIARRLWVVDLTKPLTPEHPVAFTKKPEAAEDMRIKLEGRT